MPRARDIVRDDEVGQHNSLWGRWDLGHLLALPLVGSHTPLTTGFAADHILNVDSNSFHVTGREPRRLGVGVGVGESAVLGTSDKSVAVL